MDINIDALLGQLATEYRRLKAENEELKAENAQLLREKDQLLDDLFAIQHPEAA